MGILDQSGKWVILLGLALSHCAAEAQEIRLMGRVLERAGLKPVPGARVALTSRPDASATTGADGRFTLVRAASGLGRSAIPAAAQAARSMPGPDTPAWDAAGRLAPWRPWYPTLARFLGAFGHVNTTVTPLPRRSAGAAGAGHPEISAAGQVEVSMARLLTKTVPYAADVEDLGDIVMDYPPRKLGVGAPPIYGAISLFDGARKTLDTEWEHWMGTYRITNGLGPTPIVWKFVADPMDTGMTMQTCCRAQWGDEDLVTRRKFRDFQLHVEFNLVASRAGTADPANSGVYLQSLYEIQIKDDYGMSPLGNHDAGSILNEFAAPVNLGKPLGQWQAYDITFRAARFQGGQRAEKALLTLHWNGTLVHRNRETANEHNVGVSSDPLTDGPKGLKLQSEGHDVRFRNVWLKELNLAAPDTDLGY